MKVQELMVKKVTCVHPSSPAKIIFNLMQDKKFRHIPVVDSKSYLVGIISDRDVKNVTVQLKKSPRGKKDFLVLNSIKAKDIMSTELITVRETDTLSKTVKLLTEHCIGCIPVVHEKKLKGIITTIDLLKLLTTILETRGECTKA